jgi:streptogramin lyase
VIAASAIAVVGVVLGIVLGVVVGGGGGSLGPSATARTLVRTTAADFVVEGGTGWVLDDNAGTIRPFDPATGAWRGDARPAGTRPDAIAFGYGRLWVADAVGNSLISLDPRTGRVTGQPIPVGAEPVSVAVGEGGVWVASLAAGTVSRLDPARRQVTASAVLPDGAVRVAVGDGAAWVTGLTDTLTRVSPLSQGSSLTYRVLHVGQGPIGVTTAAGAVWVADTQDGTVQRIDAREVRVSATYHVGGDPLSVAVFDGRVWVGDGQSGAVTAVDRLTGRARGAPVHLAGVVRRLLTTGGALFAGTANPGWVVRIEPA